MLALLLACASPIEPAEASVQEHAPDVASDEDCRTSCSLGDHTDDDGLDAGQIIALFEMWNEQAIGEPTMELETLLFYAPDVEAHLQLHGDDELDVQHAAFLKRELARDRVTMEMRLLDERGTERGFARADVPLREKQHIVFEGTGSLGHLETGGKVKRVGLDHLWSRW